MSVFSRKPVGRVGDPETLGPAMAQAYLPGTKGWSNNHDEIPVVLWNPVVLASNGKFGLNGGAGSPSEYDPPACNQLCFYLW